MFVNQRKTKIPANMVKLIRNLISGWKMLLENSTNKACVVNAIIRGSGILVLTERYS